MSKDVYVFDQAERPLDDGTPGTGYTANTYVYYGNKAHGPYKSSSYPNSVSPRNNSTRHNTLVEGMHRYNNRFGHNSGTVKGLNIVNSDGARVAKGVSAIGDTVDMINVNVHSGYSNLGGYMSRGAKGCITIMPDDADSFFRNFNFNGTKGTDSGTLYLYRGDGEESRAAKAKIGLLPKPILQRYIDGYHKSVNDNTRVHNSFVEQMHNVHRIRTDNGTVTNRRAIRRFSIIDML